MWEHNLKVKVTFTLHFTSVNSLVILYYILSHVWFFWSRFSPLTRVNGEFNVNNSSLCEQYTGSSLRRFFIVFACHFPILTSLYKNNNSKSFAQLKLAVNIEIIREGSQCIPSTEKWLTSILLTYGRRAFSGFPDHRLNIFERNAFYYFKILISKVGAYVFFL